MRISLVAISAIALTLSACGRSSKSVVKFDNITVTDIVATHAIATNQTVSDLVFVPNNVAPWLGRLIITDDRGNLYNTDIEGRSSEKTGTNSYISTFGINRINAAGLFFAANSDNALEAFVETSDEGQFSSMQTSGSGVEIGSFCRADMPLDNIAPFLTPDGNLSALTFDVRRAENGQMSGLEYQVSNNVVRQQPADDCVNAADTTFLLKSEGNRSMLHIGRDDSWTTLSFAKPISSIAPVRLSDQSYLVMIIEGEIYLFDIESETISHQIAINSGLSIMGIDSVDMVSSTQSNFGGGAFNEGLVAFANRQENRIVFISLNYLGSIINKPAL